MPVRSSMAQLITRTRLMIADPAGAGQQFADQDIQDTLDNYRDDIRYEGLKIAPSIVNQGGTQQSAQTIFADYYSSYQWWEADIVIQGQSAQALPWVVLNPVVSDFIVGHFQFEINVFTSGTVPGQLPPVFATGKVYDLYGASAEILEMWSATLLGAYDITVDGQSLHRSQLAAAKQKMADIYRHKAKPRLVQMVRNDVLSPIGARRMRLLDSDDVVKGA